MRYYFHLWTGKDYEVDPVGIELPDADVACTEAYRAAKDICSEMLLTREDPAKYCFEVTDAAGAKLFELPFMELMGRPRRPAPKNEVLQANVARMQTLMRELSGTITAAQRAMEMARTTLSRPGTEKLNAIAATDMPRRSQPPSADDPNR